MLPLLWHGTDTRSTVDFVEYDSQHAEKIVRELHRNALMLFGQRIMPLVHK